MEVPAFFFLMLATAGFVNLAHFLRQELSLELSDGWLMFYTLSFTYTFMALTVGASWLSFLGNHSALPWLALGILQKTYRRGLGLASPSFLSITILGGHLAPFVSITLFLSLFAMGIAIWRRSIVPLVSWGLGTGLALVIVLPLLLPAFHGFIGSDRGHGLNIEDVQLSRIPILVLPFSYFLGTFFWMVKQPEDLYVYRPLLAACAAAWCIIPALLSHSKYRLLEILCLGLLGSAVHLSDSSCMDHADSASCSLIAFDEIPLSGTVTSSFFSAPFFRAPASGTKRECTSLDRRRGSDSFCPRNVALRSSYAQSHEPGAATSFLG